jgi:hypothetical protein
MTADMVMQALLRAPLTPSVLALESTRLLRCYRAKQPHARGRTELRLGKQASHRQAAAEGLIPVSERFAFFFEKPSRRSQSARCHKGVERGRNGVSPKISWNLRTSPAGSKYSMPCLRFRRHIARQT